MTPERQRSILESVNFAETMGDGRMSAKVVRELFDALAARDAEVARLRAALESERKACNHWFSEANRDHNDLMRADAEVARLTRRTEELEAVLRDAHKFIASEYAYGGSEALFHGEAFAPEARPIIDAIARALSGAAPTEGGTA